MNKSLSLISNNGTYTKRLSNKEIEVSFSSKVEEMRK